MLTLLVCLGLWSQTAPLEAGAGRIEVSARGLTIEVFTYKPPAYSNGPMIVVAHGVGRNADEYRDHARGMGDRFGALIVAPRFDRERFSSARYNRGGLVRENGSIAPPEEWTWSLIPLIVNEVRKREGRPDMPFYLIGHSAGAQFVGRMAAFLDTGARNLVIVNPGVYLAPTRDERYGWGFADLGDLGDDTHLKRYLARPLTLYLGTGDVERDDSLDVSPESDRQGRNRLERGRNTYEQARKLAEQRGWPFHWRIVEAPGIAHDHQKMFDHPKCREALFGTPHE